MYKLLPSLNKCCFCLPLEPGLLVWAYVKLTINIIFLEHYLSRLLLIVQYENQDAMGSFYFIFGPALTILMFCLFLLYFIFNLIFNLILIVGAHKKNTALLIIFFWYAVGHAVLFSIIGGVLALYVSVLGTVNPIILALMWIPYCTSLVFYIYEIFLVSSVISKLKLATNGQVHNHWGSP